MISDHNYSVDIKKEILQTSVAPDCDPIDLSRRHESVETNKAPPSHSSSFRENSPSIHRRTQTIHRNSTSQHDHYPSHLYQPKREIPSSVDLSDDSSSTSSHRQQSFTISEALLQAAALHMNVIQRHTPARSSCEPSETSSLNTNTMSDVEDNDKLCPPLKIYRRDPLSITASSSTVERIESESAEKFRIFRKKMLQQMHASNGATVSNPNMRRNVSGSISDSANDIKDDAYYEKRRKNNVASKISRDRRKIKEAEISIRIAYLEMENMELETKLDQVKQEIATFLVSDSNVAQAQQ